jgi:serine/threonine-protein kinase RsbT
MIAVSDEMRIPIRTEMDVVTARQRARELAAPLGLSSTELIVIATAISEIARNVVSYAGQGEVILGLIRQGRRQGLSVVAQDEGPGIADLTLAMQDGYSTGGGLGMGLPGARRLMDEFEVITEPGKGTRVTMRKWATA